ncbi:MAG: hypothetical protein NXH70_02125 [Hyphomonas sp.]|nr:hypothetical protein [Hyphomonas sp.]
MQTLSMPTIGPVKITPGIADQLRSLSLVTPLNGRLFPSAGKSARLVEWMNSHATRKDPEGQQVYIRFS